MQNEKNIGVWSNKHTKKRCVNHAPYDKRIIILGCEIVVDKEINKIFKNEFKTRSVGK